MTNEFPRKNNNYASLMVPASSTDGLVPCGAPVTPLPPPTYTKAPKATRVRCRWLVAGDRAVVTYICIYI